MQKVFLYNTATRKKEEFKPIKEGEVGIYSCGPTVYSSPLIGNMYAYIVWDSLVRSLRYLGYKVTWVMNVTDVGHLVADSNDGEDKMELGSKREGLTAWEIAKKYETEFFDNFEKLNIKRPDVVCRATEYISEQIELLKKIEENGFTYRTSDGIYFDTKKFPGYGDFAHLDIEQIKEGARVEQNSEKRNPSDFALWKFSPKNEKRQMEWDSPWGVGFPGWHLECTAMSTKHLGNIFDIHTGGIDHISIHHTNEIAQGFGAFGHQTANYWLHNAFITFGGAKISKSTSGVLTLNYLISQGFEPLAYRYMVLSSQYRRAMEYTEENLKNSTTAFLKLRKLVGELPDGGKIEENYKKLFEEKIADDLAMPEVMALVWKLAKDESVKAEDRKATLLDFDKVLGLDLDKKVAEEDVPEEIEELGKKRLEAKMAKDWAEADKLRDEIKAKGYIIEDSPDGYKFKKV